MAQFIKIIMVFVAVMLAGKIADGPLKRTEQACQEIDAVICEDKQCWGVE